MKILICNPDEAEAKQLAAQIKAFSKNSGIKLDTVIYSNPVDVIAGNIKFEIAIIESGMKDINGITLGKILRKTIPYIQLIYTSSQNKSLDASFDIQAVRYYKRPFTQARFEAGLREALRRIENENICFSLSDGDMKVNVPKRDILYIEIESRKTKIVTYEKTYYSPNPLAFWKEHIHGVKFLTPHKSFLVNMDYVRYYKRNNFLVMTNKDVIPISRAKSADFHKQYTDYYNLML